jgi:hypothetical protein
MKNSNKSWLSKWLGVAFIGIILFIIMAPYLFTQLSLFPWIDFDKTSSMGDTIGGITAPIIGVFSALLVYITFREQVKANAMQVKALNDDKKERNLQSSFNLILTELNWCSTEYDKFEFNNVFGVAAVDELIKKREISKTSNSEMLLIFQKLLSLVGYLNKMNTMIDNLNSDKYQAILANKMLFIYRSKTRKYKSKILEYSDNFEPLLDKSKEEISDLLTFHKYTVEKLEKYRFSFHNKNY